MTKELKDDAIRGTIALYPDGRIVFEGEKFFQEIAIQTLEWRQKDEYQRGKRDAVQNLIKAIEKEASL